MNKSGCEGAVEFFRELDPPPEYIAKRLTIWNELKKKYDEQLAVKQDQNIQIKVRVKDLPVVNYKAFKDTSYDVINSVDSKLAKRCIAVYVNDVLWDLKRPLETDSEIVPVTIEDDAGKEVLWHSTAHLCGEAMELCYGGDLCYGPTIEEGFYYDMYMPDNKTVSKNHFSCLEELIKKFVKENQHFERIELTKDDLEKLFAYNPFKLRIIKEKVNSPTATVYRCGTLVDLCRGPHVPHSGVIGAFKLIKNSSSYWEGDCTKEALQRIYGISFKDKKALREWEHFQAQAAKCNHRRIGIEQELFFFHEMSPGSCFFYPRGTHIYNKLVETMRNEYRNRGFVEVITPNLFNHKLWITSGHWEHYAENMFQFDIDKEKYALKPMNCPGHCLMYASRPRSWKDLPLRYADFGVLHRNELSGALSGLTRVRRFQQDDAHIFCTHEQIKSEIRNCLLFMRWTYGIFGFDFKLVLSTRPEKFLGAVETWNVAEQQLKEALDEFGEKWELNPGDGAFYGPKIDITISDALKRQHQCATIQLDFQLPLRFNLEYATGEDNAMRTPIIIHRAILGSVERMMGIITEHFAGKWPLWLSPMQAIVIPVTSGFDNYARAITKQIWDAGFQAEYNVDPSETLNKKIREAQVAQFNFILVVGEKEESNNTVNVRTRDQKVLGEVKIEEFIDRLKILCERRSNNAEEEFCKATEINGDIKELKIR